MRGFFAVASAVSTGVAWNASVAGYAEMARKSTAIRAATPHET